MFTRPLLRASLAARRAFVHPAVVRGRTVFIAPGDAARHAEPGFAWLGTIASAGAATFVLCQVVVSIRLRREEREEVGRTDGVEESLAEVLRCLRLAMIRPGGCAP